MNFTTFFSNINPKEVIKNLPDAVFVVDFDGKIIWANDKAGIIFETNTKNLKNYNLNEIVVNGLDLAEKSYSRRNSIVTGAFTCDGKEIFIEMNAKKYIDQFFITIRDVTAMTNVLANAERTGRLNKEKNIMLVKLSNEFKSPIQSIIGFSQALIDGLGGKINEKQDKYVKIINKNSTELLYFMEKFLEFAQAESSLLKLENQPFDIINTIQTVIRNNDSTIGSKNITINYDFDNFNKKTIFSDENALKTIIQNIIENSLKLTETGSLTIKLEHPQIDEIETRGTVPIKNTDENSYLKISITDTGIGLTENEIEGIFEPYTQLDKSNKKAIVRSITLGSAQTLSRRLNGAIWIESEVMKGTTFSVIIPIVKVN